MPPNFLAEERDREQRKEQRRGKGNRDRVRERHQVIGDEHADHRDELQRATTDMLDDAMRPQYRESAVAHHQDAGEQQRENAAEKHHLGDRVDRFLVFHEGVHHREHRDREDHVKNAAPHFLAGRHRHDNFIHD